MGWDKLKKQLSTCLVPLAPLLAGTDRSIARDRISLEVALRHLEADIRAVRSIGTTIYVGGHKTSWALFDVFFDVHF